MDEAAHITGDLGGRDHSARAVPGRVDQPKFTPGPWRLDDEWVQPEGHLRPEVDVRSDERIICSVYIWEGEGEDANAHLIYAAPALYAALVAARRELWDRDRGVWNLADWKNFAAVQQIDAALRQARREA